MSLYLLSPQLAALIQELFSSPVCIPSPTAARQKGEDGRNFQNLEILLDLNPALNPLKLDFRYNNKHNLLICMSHEIFGTYLY